jgi:hypothetical protein
VERNDRHEVSATRMSQCVIGQRKTLAALPLDVR